MPREARRRRVTTATPSDVIRFWRTAGAYRWFQSDPEFDHRFRLAFVDTHFAAARRELDDWQAASDGCLALLLLTDQFPRNAFRGSAHMYATDPLARHYAAQAQDAGYMQNVEHDMQLFFCLPFAHSEEDADQKRSVALHLKLGEPWLTHARGHRNIIRRFGRFPHRNRLLGRETTPEEQSFLDCGGFAG